MADKLIGHIIPVRFALFALIGALGLIIRLAALRVGLSTGSRVSLAQTIAKVIAMTFNFS